MIVDTSALIAILRDEPDAPEIERALVTADGPKIAAPTYLEAGIVADGFGDPVISRRLDEIVEAALIEVVPFTELHAAIARSAYRDFGKRSGHPAQLNFGDCISYALAAAGGEPLLFKGDDFSHTDIKPARS